MKKVILTNWIANTLLLVLVGVVSYGIFLAVMFGTNQPEERAPELAPLATACAQT